MRLTPLKTNLLTNTSVQFFSRLVSGGLSFLITLFIIRYLGISFYGNFVKVTTLLYFGYILVDLGLNAVIVRRLNNLSSSEQSQLLADFLNLRFFLAFLFVFLVSSWLFFFTPSGYSSDIKLAFVLGSSSIFFLAFHLTATSTFQLDLAYYKPALATITGSFIFLPLSLYLALHHLANLPFLILANSLGYFLTAFISFLFVRHRFSFRYPNLSRSWSLFLLSFWLILTFIFSSLANKADVFVASFYRSSLEIGQYGFAYKIFDFIVIIPTLFMNVVYPFLLRAHTNKKQLILKSSLWLFFLSLVLISLFYPLAPLILFLKPNLYLSVVILRCLLLSLPLFYLTSPLMWFLVSLHQEIRLVFIYALATLVNLTLNFIYLPHHPILVSAWITLVTEATIFLLLLFFSLPYLRQSPPRNPNPQPTTINH